MADDPPPLEETISDPPPAPEAAGDRKSQVLGVVQGVGSLIGAGAGAVVRKSKDLGGKVTDVAGRVSGKVTEKVQVVRESETYQKTTGFISDKAVKVKDKTVELGGKAMENERVAGVVNKTKEKTGEIWEGTKRVSGTVVEKTGEGYGKVKEKVGVGYEKTKEGISYTGEKLAEGKEFTKAKAGEIWEKGRGKMVKIKNAVGDLSVAGWRGNAKETLLAREEARKRWADIKVRGAEEVNVPRRSEHTTTYFVEKGSLLRWSFQCQDYDVGFGVRARVMQDGGSREEDILAVEKFDNTNTIEGSWMADEDRTIVLVFDNTYSKLRSKNVAYLVGVDPAGKEVEGENICTPQSDMENDNSEGAPPVRLTEDVQPEDNADAE